MRGEAHPVDRGSARLGAHETREVSFDCGPLVLRGERWPGGEAGPLLFLHGVGQTRHSWRRPAALLAASGWDCTSIDLRGHGSSDWAPDGDYRITSYAEDLRHVVARSAGTPVIVGASLGGLAALLAEGEHHLARALILVDIVPRPKSYGRQRVSEFMTRHLDGFASLEEVAAAVERYTRRPRGRNLEGLRKNVRLHDDGRWYWHWDPRIMTMGDDRQATADTDAVLRVADRVGVPVLVVRGALSDVVDDSGVEELLATVPSARIVEVSGAGHMVAGDDNDRFLTAITRFLDEFR